MENYIMINGKKAELTEEQLKKLGIEIKSKNPFNNKSDLKYEDIYYSVGAIGVRESNYNRDSLDETTISKANNFNDKDFAFQVQLHQEFYRKLLKYSYDQDAVDKEWNNTNRHFFVYLTNGEFNINSVTHCKDQNIYFSKEGVARNAAVMYVLKEAKINQIKDFGRVVMEELN